MVMATVQEHRFTFPEMGAGVLRISLSMVSALSEQVSLGLYSKVLWPLTLIHWYSLQDYLHYLCVIATSLSVLYLLYKENYLLVMPTHKICSCQWIYSLLYKLNVECQLKAYKKNKQWCNVMMYRQLMCECSVVCGCYTKVNEIIQCTGFTRMCSNFLTLEFFILDFIIR